MRHICNTPITSFPAALLFCVVNLKPDGQSSPIYTGRFCSFLDRKTTLCDGVNSGRAHILPMVPKKLCQTFCPLPVLFELFEDLCLVFLVAAVHEIHARAWVCMVYSPQRLKDFAPLRG